jgi:hypothetical protein
MGYEKADHETGRSSLPLRGGASDSSVGGEDLAGLGLYGTQW